MIPTSAKWPDIRLASTLRSLMGSQSGGSDGAAEPPKQERGPLPSASPRQGVEEPDPAMASPQEPLPDDPGAISSHGDDDPMAGQDGSFGALELELFDSNAPQAPHPSSQAPAAPSASGRQASEAIMSGDAAQPPSSSKKLKRDKDKKKKASLRQLESTLPLVDADDGSRKKHRKSRKKPIQDFQVPDSQPQNDAAVGDQVPSSPEIATGSLTQLSDAVAGLIGNDEAMIPSTQSKKRRKASDSTDSKRRKKRRSHDQEAGGDGNADNSVATASASSFLRRKEQRVIESGSAIEEDIEPETNPQESPTVAHLRRRSQTGEAHSRENSIPPVDAHQMDIDPSTNEAGAAAARGNMEVDPDVEALAREAWNEHRNGHLTHNSTENAHDADETAITVPEPLIPSHQRRWSSRKKAKPTFFEQPPVEEPASGADADREALAELPSPAAMTPKPRNRAKTAARKKDKGERPKKAKISQSMRGGSDDDAGNEESYPRRRNRLIGFTQGRFSFDELSRIARAVESFGVDNGLTQAEVNEMIHAPGGTTAGDAHAQLWVRIFAECPDRHRQKLINITRKKFHNYVARATWTPEQEVQLSELITVHGTKWAKIGAIINRHPEDLRDRYRNYLVCGPHQRKDPWDEAEEARLTQYIIDAMETNDDLRRSGPNKDLLNRSYEGLIDWQSISERMGRTRSRLQCITKWKSMNIRTNGTDKLASGEPDSQISFRLEKARRQIAAMPEEERFRMVLAIQAASVGNDAKVPWKRLVDKQFRNQWHRSTQVLLWQRLKQTVPGWETRTARDCAQHLVEQYNQTGELPDVCADGYDDVQEMELIRKIASSFTGPNGTPAGNGSGKKSADFIEDSDAEEDEVDAAAANEEMDDDLQIDPALVQTPAPAKKAASAKRTGAGKPPSRNRAKKAPTATMNPIQDDDEDRQQPMDDREDGSEIDMEKLRKKKTPSKFKSPMDKITGQQPPPRSAGSVNAMDDMEDLPARV